MIGHIILRLTMWFLLTANFTPANIMIGVAIAFLLPRNFASSETLGDWLKVIIRVFIAIPQAYKEAFEIIFRPHKEEEIILERISGKRSPRLAFWDIFLITFTPKTIVTEYKENEGYEVHVIKRSTLG
ncbi:Na+/H+ antiporter subunit E [Microcystis aeruginosa]|uniref:Na+/H+ antiporter subunit E n=1 Tax=Microcystis aeruginosa TaxID=1126 RepID=UPI00232EA2B7|nr:Na+/H+ antiporter subunit E [Microcystis aeruginosa]MDB9417886.1 Na+/H+ antiporter subunit E [Microcystis aeruginosa CS-556/03]